MDLKEALFRARADERRLPNGRKWTEQEAFYYEELGRAVFQHGLGPGWPMYDYWVWALRRHQNGLPR